MLQNEHLLHRYSKKTSGIALIRSLTAQLGRNIQETRTSSLVFSTEWTAVVSLRRGRWLDHSSELFFLLSAVRSCEFSDEKGISHFTVNSMSWTSDAIEAAGLRNRCYCGRRRTNWYHRQTFQFWIALTKILFVSLNFC